MKDKLGENEAATLVDFVHSEVKSEFELQKMTLATKDDVREVRQDMAEMKSELLRSMYVAMGLSSF